jgi:colanic acid/amylovoran biosynthesis glycosyltransferase
MSLGYLFERFPRFTQTFCAREVVQLYRQDLRVPVFSIYRPNEPIPQIAGMDEVDVRYLPSTKNPVLIAQAHLFSPRLQKIWVAGGDRRDKRRYREAIYLGPKLRSAGITHLHVHFASIAAHTAWWLKRLFGITYSFTGHANDIFCPRPEHRISLSEVVKEASFIVAVTDYSANRLKKEFPEAAAKIFRVYNGLDISLFRTANPEIQPLRIISVGRLIEKKGWPYLIETCALLRDKKIQFDCRIIGEGPDASDLQQLIRSRQLEEKILLTGPKTQSEIIDLLEKSSLFVLPAIRDRSGDSDNLPTVLVEALASGLPVVSTDIAGIPEIVEQGRNGLLVPEKDPIALAMAIQSLSSDQRKLQQFGIASRQIAEQTFAQEITVRQLKDLFGGR